MITGDLVHALDPAALALHQAVYHPGSLVLLVSLSLRQSGELFRKVVAHLRTFDHEPTLTESNRLSLSRSRAARGSSDCRVPKAPYAASPARP